MRCFHRLAAPGILSAFLLLSAEACAIRSPEQREAERQERGLAEALRAGEVTKGQQRLPAAIAAAERSHASDPLALADALDRFADSFSSGAARSPEALANAEALRRRALDLRQAVLGGSDPRVGESLSNLSTAYYDQGRWDLAEEYERRALAVFESGLGATSLRAARSVRELATVLFQEGRYLEAASLAERALATLERLPLERGERARSLNVWLEIRRVQGRYDEAEAAGRRGLEMARTEEKTDDVLVADLLNNLAGLYKDQGRYDEAEAALRDVMDLWKRDPEANAYDLSTACLNQADIMQLQGRVDEAAPLLAQALAGARRQLGDSDPHLATFLNRAALVHARQGRHDEAEPLYRSALALLERTTPSHPDVAQTLHDLANLRRELEQYDDARGLYERALAIREAVFGARHPEVGLTLTELARCLHLEGPIRDEEALATVDRAVVILSATSAYPEARADALALQAEIRRRRGDTAGALSAMATALDIVEDLRPRTGGSDATRAEFLARYAGHFRRMASWLLETDRVDEAVDYAERGRARVLLDQLAVARVDLGKGIPLEVRERLERRDREARARLAEVQARLAFTEARSDLEPAERAGLSTRLASELDAAARDLQQAGSELRRASPLWRGLVTAGGRPAPIEGIRSELLAPGRVLLLYLVGPEESQVVVVPAKPSKPMHRMLRVGPQAAAVLEVRAGNMGPRVLETVLGGGGRQGAGLVAALGLTRGLARVSEGDETVRAGADARLQALFETLVPSDVWPLLRNASEVLLVPDGALHRVPFEALVVSRAPDGRPRYWLDEGPVVRYSPSLTTAYNLGRSEIGRGTPSSSSALVVANPAFERPGESAASGPPARSSTRQWAGALASLPGTAREAALIRAALAPSGTDVLILAEGAAEEAAVRSALSAAATALRPLRHPRARRREPERALGRVGPDPTAPRPERPRKRRIAAALRDLRARREVGADRPLRVRLPRRPQRGRGRSVRALEGVPGSGLPPGGGEPLARGRRLNRGPHGRVLPPHCRGSRGRARLRASPARRAARGPRATRVVVPLLLGALRPHRSALIPPVKAEAGAGS